MKFDNRYENPQMEQYFRSLPPKVQNFILDSHAEIGSLGDLMLIGEHFRHSLGCDDDGK